MGIEIYSVKDRGQDLAWPGQGMIKFGRGREFPANIENLPGPGKMSPRRREFRSFTGYIYFGP